MEDGTRGRYQPRPRIQSTCVRCFAPFTGRPYRGAPPRYCTKVCAQAAYQAARPKRSRDKSRKGIRLPLSTCARCGVTFRPKQSKFSTYCTRGCGWKGQARPRSEAAWLGKTCSVPWKTCQQCGGQFYGRGVAKTCSDACRGYRRRSGESKSRVCVECGAAFSFIVGAKRPPATCSDLCKEQRSARQHAASAAKGKAVRAARLDAQPSELVPPIEIYLRDGWRCQICGGTVEKRAKVPHPKAPTLDHIIPVSLGGAHTRQNLRLAHFLCNSKRGNAGAAQLVLIG